MVGEIVGGVAAGVTQGVGAAVMEAPVTVAQTAVVSAAEVVTPVVQSVPTGAAIGVDTTTEAIGSVSNLASAVGQVSPVSSFISETTQTVARIQEEVGITLLAESMAESLTGITSNESEILSGRIEGLLTDRVDTESVMRSLGEGLLTGHEDVPTVTLIAEAQNMTNFSNGQLAEVFAAVDTIDIPRDMLDDPTFREDMAQHLFKQATAQKEDMTKREDLMAMMQKSAEAAKEKYAQRQEVVSSTETKKDKEELENLKKKATLEAVRRQTDMWRQSVMMDKRLNQDAREIALKKIDKVETRLMVQTQMKWNGKSLLKMIAVAALWLTE